MSTPTARKPWPADKLPLRVRGIVCPICGGALLITDVEACELADNGDWIASEVNIDCENEPDMDSDEWEDWHRWHYSEPYTDWLPVDRIILRFLRANYRFPSEEVDTPRQELHTTPPQEAQ